MGLVYGLLGFLEFVVVGPFLVSDGLGVDVLGCEAGLGGVVPFPSFGKGGKISCLGRDVRFPGVGDGVQFLGLDYGIYFLGLDVGVQVRGFVNGGQVLGLPLCFPLVHDLDDSVQVCCFVVEDQVYGLLCSMGTSPWIAWVSFDIWRAWALMEVREVRGPICRCPGIGVSGLDCFANDEGVPAVGVGWSVEAVGVLGPGGVAVTHANDTFDDTPGWVVVVVGQVHCLLYLGLGRALLMMAMISVGFTIWLLALFSTLISSSLTFLFL